MATTMEELRRKAQAYDKALEKAKRLYEKGTITESLCHIFPELKESEDERVRKELIIHCRNTRCVTEEGAERIAKWIAWLKKQGERKPAWSEEDENILNNLINYLKVDDALQYPEKQVVEWLQFIKQRIGG